MSVESECPVCDEPLSRLWVVPPPHTDEFHEQVRRRLLNYFKILFREKVAGLLGHKVVVRFTQDHAWTECSCGWSGAHWSGSSAACYQGHSHLHYIGSQFEMDELSNL